MLEGTFMWAVEQMKQGKKVRRKSWYNKDCIQIKGKNYFSWDDKLNLELIFNVEWIEGTDWEIFEENKFGIFMIRDRMICDHRGKPLFCIREDLLVDMENTLKRAREMQC